MRYIGTHMHLHSCYEVLGSMHGHCMQAKKFGLEAVWFTDHDTFMGARRALNGYNFETGLLHTEDKKSIDKELMRWMELMESLGESPDQELWRQVLEKTAVPPARTGFRQKDVCATSDIELETSDAYIGKNCMRMQVQSGGADWKCTAAEFDGWKKRMNRPLIADVSIGLAFRLDKPLDADCRVVIEFAFSQQPPDLQVAKLIYCAGDAGDLDSDGAAVVPFSLRGDGIWQYVLFHVSQDAEKHVPGGLDNAFQNLVIRIESRNGEKFSLLVDQLNIWEQHHLQELMLRQRDLGREIGEKFGIKVFVTTEVSMAGHHKNCFSEHVPIMDYPAHGYHITHEDAVSYLKDQNAVFAFNHPFIEYQHLPLTEIQREKIVEHEIETLIQDKCYGAPLLEVAFPDGRYGFLLEHYLRLWDRLGMHGIYVTGYGDSDNHRCDERWENGNNFAAYIAADRAECKDLCEGMLRGDLYSADPARSVRLESFTLAEHPEMRMGSIVSTARAMVELQVTLTGCESSVELLWIDDGEVKERILTEDEAGTYRHTYLAGKQYGLSRIEVYDESGRCLLISNPIYFLKDKSEVLSSRKQFELAE